MRHPGTLTLIKRIGSNDVSHVRLAREKNTRELVSGQHHRTPPIACGNTCSMTKRPTSMRASALSPPIEHQRKRRLRGIEIGKRTLNGNASTAEQIVGKIARQVNTRGAQGRNGIQGKASRGLGRKLLDRMTSANGNNTGGRAAQRGNVRGALAGAAQIASERTDIGTLAH